MSGCDNGPSCCTEKVRRARKTHRCCECGDAIKPGDAYVYLSGIWDGSPSSYRTCLTCDAWRNGLSAAIRAIPGTYLCDCIELGGLAWALSEFCQEELGYRPDGKPNRWAAIVRTEPERSTVL